jgi:hypothetical protein
MIFPAGELRREQTDCFKYCLSEGRVGCGQTNRVFSTHIKRDFAPIDQYNRPPMLACQPFWWFCFPLGYYLTPNVINFRVLIEGTPDRFQPGVGDSDIIVRERYYGRASCRETSVASIRDTCSLFSNATQIRMMRLECSYYVPSVID